MFKKIKEWFKESQSKFLVWITGAIGMITTVVGSMDFAPLWSLFSTGTDFTPKQVLFIGISIVGTAVTMELARGHK